MEDMLEQYNGGFGVGYTTVTKEDPYDSAILSPGEEGFIPSKMLMEEYFVWEDATLVLSAPNNCVSIKWVLTDPDDENSVVLFHPFGLEEYGAYDKWNESLFRIYIPESGLKSNKVYEITLTVTDKEGSEYKDTAAIVVYKHIYY